MPQSRKGHLLQRAEGRESLSQDPDRSRDIMRKVEKIRRKQLFRQQIFSVHGMSGVYEAKFRMLKNNNRSLARALSEQKMETNHWYTEAISLKGELQEAQEKLLRIPDSNVHLDSAFVEAEKQIKECCEAIDKDFDLALERIVEAVEKLTKAKHLVVSTLSLIQCPSRSLLNTFSRTSGSRTPLEASGVSPSPRQRAVLPMVGGHVLQPVMVPLPKLKIEWNNRRKNHTLVREGNDLEMSAIGEESLLENGGVSEGQPSQNSEEHQPLSDIESTNDDGSQSDPELDSVNLGVRLEEDTYRRSSLRHRTRSSPKLQNSRLEGMRIRRRRQGLIRRGSKSGTEQGQCSKTSKFSPAKASKPLEGTEGHMAAQHDDDPLEGPSWLFNRRESQACRGRVRGRRVRLNNQKDVEGANDAGALESSNGNDAGVDISQKFKQVAVQEPSLQIKDTSTTISTKDNPSQSLDLSCCDSPTSMLTRLEILEVQGGRKSKRFLKCKMRIGSSKSSELPAEAAPISLHENKFFVGDTLPNTEKIPHEFSREKDQEIELMTENKVTEGHMATQHDVPFNTSSALLSERIGETTDNDLTCQIVTNMDITQPVSNIVIHQSPTTSTDLIQDGFKFPQSKKFFKTREPELIDKITKVVEKTPFDLSMLNESVVDLPPFSATRTTEKENLPPLSAESNDDCVSLCDVSVVLEDVLKEPVYSNRPKRSVRIKQKGSQSAKCISSNTPKKQRNVTRRTLQYPLNNSEGSDETWEPKRARQTSKRRTKKVSPSTVHMPVECTPVPKLKSLKKNTPKSFDDDLGDTHSGVKELEERNPHVSSEKTDSREILSNCYVMVHRTSIVETPVPSIDKDQCPRKDLQDNLHIMPDLQQQLSENEKNPIRKLEGATSDADHIDKEGNGKHIGKRIDKYESKEDDNDVCILLDAEEPYDKKQNQQSESKQQQQQQQPDDDKHSVRVHANQYFGFEGFESSQASRTSRRENELLPPTTETLVGVDYHGVIEKTNAKSPKVKTQKSKSRGIAKHNYKTRKSSDSTSNAEEHLPIDYPRKRRAVLKTSSYKEVSLRIKLRQGARDAVCTSSRKGKGKSKSKSKSRSRSRSRGKVVEDEVSS